MADQRTAPIFAGRRFNAVPRGNRFGVMDRRTGELVCSGLFEWQAMDAADELCIAAGRELASRVEA